VDCRQGSCAAGSLLGSLHLLCHNHVVRPDEMEATMTRSQNLWQACTRRCTEAAPKPFKARAFHVLPSRGRVDTRAAQAQLFVFVVSVLLQWYAVLQYFASSHHDTTPLGLSTHPHRLWFARSRACRRSTPVVSVRRADLHRVHDACDAMFDFFSFLLFTVSSSTTVVSPPFFAKAFDSICSLC
jgi:hypothetical protein